LLVPDDCHLGEGAVLCDVILFEELAVCFIAQPVTYFIRADWNVDLVVDPLFLCFELDPGVGPGVV
jgi:hypothetical protein